MPEVTPPHFHFTCKEDDKVGKCFAPLGYSFQRAAPVHMNQSLPWELVFRCTRSGFFVIFYDAFGDEQFRVYVEAAAE
jgi:hypothetical protein